MSLDEEYSLLGGGFEVNYNPGKGNLATGSFPVDSSTWEANSKDMEIPDSCSITVFVIGIKTQLTKRDNTGVDKPTGQIIITKFKSVDSYSAAHPSSSAEVPPGYVPYVVVEEKFSIRTGREIIYRD